MGTAGQDDGSMVNAEDFIAFATRLRRLRERVDEAPISEEQRRRWHRKLAAVSTAGAEDLLRASGQLSRFEAEVDRVIGA